MNVHKYDGADKTDAGEWNESRPWGCALIDSLWTIVPFVGSDSLEDFATWILC